ncbi:MAG: nucleotidyltransferase [Desulfuromonadales bacterium]
MRIVGLITEYNPFHNGHLHHLRESLRSTGADASVAVMSGHFLQRGEPALVDKWIRTEMALAAGVDLVLELPFPFACNSAPVFAMGAVQVLDALGVVDAFCFGSESGSLASLRACARLLIDRADEIASTTAARLRQGVSYPVARAEVISGLAQGLPPGLISSPNNVLAIEYLRALDLTGSSLQPCRVQRLGPGYHSLDAGSQIASATGIRKRIADGERFDPYLPRDCLAILQQALGKGRRLDPDRLFLALQTLLLQDPMSLKGLYQIDHGLEQRLANAAMTANSYAELVYACKSRQWTLTRIQRVLTYVLLQVPGDVMRDFLRQGPMYLRLLGTSGRGRAMLARARKKKSLPLIADPARAKAALRRFYRDRPQALDLAEQMLDCDLRATRLYGLLQATPCQGHSNQDFFQAVRQTE